MNNTPKLLICLYSDPNFLAVNLLEILLSKNCYITVVSNEKELWLKRTNHLAFASRFSIINIDDYKKLINFSYAIFCGGFLEKEKAYIDFKKFLVNKNFGKAKTLAIFPFEVFSQNDANKISISDNAGMIYVGDLLGPRIDLQSNLLLPTLINEMTEKRTLTLGVGEIFYPLFCPDAARTIIKWLLSFGPYGRDSFFLGPQTSSSNFWKLNIKSFPGLKILYDTKIETRFVPKGYDIITANSNINLCFNETYKWFIQEKEVDQNNKIKLPVIRKPHVKKPSRLRQIRPFLLPVFLILIFPLITTVIAMGLLFLSYKQFLTENLQGSVDSALLAKTTFTIGKGESDVLSRIPVLGKFYDETSYVSYAGITISDTSIAAIPVIEDGRQIFLGVLANGVKNITIPSQEIKSGLSDLYDKLSSFDGITIKKANLGLISARQVLGVVDFDKLKNLAQQTSVLAGNLPAILGVNQDKNYLILFENNMELRATGGFIGSYGIANFGGGKMNGLTINDIYSADGQLKGHVEPPLPIKKYLGEANWWFRDSNWSPDFPTSAERAEWFLNKETGQQVDGVIAIDLEPIKNILNYTGPIFLPDYNMSVTSNNLYEKTQEEAQSNFFPGSRQKASFLTALSRVLISQITKMNPKDRLAVLKSIFDSLESRHIQVYLHSRSSQDALANLSWDGSVQDYSCGSGCYSDLVGDVESNVGDNKANYFIKRNFDLNVNFNGQTLTRQFSINLQNFANPSLGPSGIYKTYIRVLVPSDSEILSVRSVTPQSQTELSPEITQESGRQEVGIFVQITPGQTQDFEFTWQNNISADTTITSYGIYFRKQAGVDAAPTSIEFTGVGGLTSRPIFSLTNGSVYTYNTDLVKDFFARLSWK